MKNLSRLTALLLALVMLLSITASATEVMSFDAYRTSVVAADSEIVEAVYFKVNGVSGVSVPSEGISAGKLTADTVPQYEGYEFVNATINDIDVISVGKIVVGTNEYVYYTTEGSDEGLTALVLKDGEKISLNYAQDAIDIVYTVTVGGVEDEDGVVRGIPYGGDTKEDISIIAEGAPSAIYPGHEYSFIVEIPRGYTATVSVNGTELEPELGVSPSYAVKNEETIYVTANSPSKEYTLSALYTVENPQDVQNVVVSLKEDTRYDFNADLFKSTKYVGNGSRASSEVNGVSGWTGIVNADGSMTWSMTTESQSGSQKWIMDALQINGTDINIAFSNGDTGTAVTTLPSGTVIEMTRKENRSNGYNRTYSYTYTITVSNCYEDLVVTGGNFNGTTWLEYIPYVFTGVDTYEYNARNTSSSPTNSGSRDVYVVGPIAQPISYGNTGSTNMYGGSRMRFTLLPGYVNPKVTFLANDAETVLETITTFGNTTVDGAVYYTFDPDESKWSGKYPILMKIEAEVGIYTVKYSSSVNALLPVDTTDYSIAAGYSDQILISSKVPVDSTGKKAFVGWKVGNTEYMPGDVVALTDVTDSATNKVITFEAVWENVETASQITYNVEFVDENGVKIEGYGGAYLAPANTALVVNPSSPVVTDFLAVYPWYEIASDNTLYYEAIKHGDTIRMKVVEKSVVMNYQVVAPAGVDVSTVGTVSLESETLKMKTGKAEGSTATASSTTYKFVGWYSHASCYEEDRLSTDKTYVPTKADDAVWPEVTTYYAKFEYNLTTLTIKKSGLNQAVYASGDSESAIFTVVEAGTDKTWTIALNEGNGFEVTLDGLTIGTEYTITELTDWTWRYTAGTNSINHTLVATVNGKVVEFSNTRTNPYWLGGDNYKVNVFGEAGPGEPKPDGSN